MQVKTKAVVAQYAVEPEIVNGRMTSDQLIYSHARYTFNGHGTDYLTVPDSSILCIGRYLARYDNYGITDATHVDLVAILDALPIGSRVTNHRMQYGWRNQIQRSKYEWLKVATDAWVVQD